MNGQDFGAMLDELLPNPLLRGLDIACLRHLPADESWWSPQTYRTLEIYLYPGAFGSERLRSMDVRGRRLVEETAARLAGAHEARLLPAPPVPLRIGEWLMGGGYSVMSFGSVLFVASSPILCGASLLFGAGAVAGGRVLYAAMWQRAGSLRRVGTATPSVPTGMAI